MASMHEAFPRLCRWGWNDRRRAGLVTVLYASKRTLSVLGGMSSSLGSPIFSVVSMYLGVYPFG